MPLAHGLHPGTRGGQTLPSCLDEPMLELILTGTGLRMCGHEIPPSRGGGAMLNGDQIGRFDAGALLGGAAC